MQLLGVSWTINCARIRKSCLTENKRCNKQYNLCTACPLKNIPVTDVQAQLQCREVSAFTPTRSFRRTEAFSSSSGRQISSLLFRASILAPVLMILDREARTFANQQRCVKLPLLSDKSLVRSICRRWSSICQLISGWPVFYSRWLWDSQLSARYSRFMVNLITHLQKNEWRLKGELLYSLTTRNPVEPVTICADVTLCCGY